ncbi:MAG: DNA repair protein RadA [Ignavibacteria bacterium GWF2_33_9]|nr:MAG: DNA repair protein RadA [Ignavibacteria bacterium GWF2_33_9]
MKSKIFYVCGNCGYRSARWQGRCPSCESWNSFLEEETKSSTKKSSRAKAETPILISEVKNLTTQRITIGINEFDRVLGGGLVPGSVVLIGGDPGIGKSTLLLQVSGKTKPGDCLYVSGEESKQQIALRFKRVFQNQEDLQILPETNLETILATLENNNYDFAIIDSIQSVYSSDIDGIPGSLTQIRECAIKLTEFAKRTNTSVFLIGHVTKEGFIAGPKVLEHMVDVVLQFEGEKNYSYRILRTLKNRFGSTNEIGIFEMVDSGLREVSNPSELFLAEVTNTPGVAISAVIEGSRPIIIESQALVTSTGFSYPQRTTNGFDIKRLQLILAVLEKRIGISFSNKDVFVNIAGGFRIDDTSLDLAIACALISSNSEISIPDKTVIIGEIGLTGEVRNVPFIEQRINEAIKLGFTNIILPEVSKGKFKKKTHTRYEFVTNLNDIFSKIFG